MSGLRQWAAPEAPAPITATVVVPGSKSETNRALILAALASGPSVISGGLEARDTQLMRDALRTLGVDIVENNDQWQITPPQAFVAGGTIDCGLAGTVMRFVPPIAALADGTVRFDGDKQAYARPMAPLLGALKLLGAKVDGNGYSLPFNLTGNPQLPGGEVTVNASASSQFLSGLLIAGARYADGIDIQHIGNEIPSRPHVQMTLAMLRARGVDIDDTTPDRWVVSPGAIQPLDVAIEPDLSNAAPFLAAAAITGGTVTVPNWPSNTIQPGDAIREILQRFGANVTLEGGSLRMHGTDHLRGVDLDLSDAAELTPVVAAVAALADGTSHLRGISHIRGHETDRLAALETELDRLGSHVSQTEYGLTIHPRLLGGDLWHTYADHRMAQAGALLGLVVPEIVLDDIGCTGKTMPEFEHLWTTMIDDSVEASAGEAIRQ
ncbi:MAG TPA: 3-phosphoshikimate 1-carboxyvinyltransferase [Propionibacteriaceae bacterium]|jgi:3-phosphoshikimate 1-carboxyvinyltransferase|nr:3-phosphoshikimate 1-carboxyvinyltransferase [Propionibacteriaceae bacterium]